MSQFAYKSRLPRQYTITDARTDIEYLGQRFDILESDRQNLDDEVKQARHDEWRALDLCRIMKQRLDVMERLLLLALSPEGQKLLTHQIITEMRLQAKVGVA